jgi:hypothetical protein
VRDVRVDRIQTPWFQKYQVDVPEGESGLWCVSRFEVTAEAAKWENLRAMIGHTSRPIQPGWYTRLTCQGRGVVMSDTPIEISDHRPALNKLERESTRRVLIHGLGLGMVLRWALRQPHIEHVDVVELERDVIELVYPHYANDDRLTLHHGDALDYRFPPGTRWDVAWHDIWDDITSENLPQVARLKRRYGRRAEWQEAWCEHDMRRTRYY